MTMRERIAAGKLFTDMCEGLPEERTAGKTRMKQFNDSPPDNPDERRRLLSAMLGRAENVWIEPPFYFCYGTHIFIGENTCINCNCTFVDDGTITIGSGVLFGPSMTVATVGHPVWPAFRAYMYAAPVQVGDSCWIGAGAVLCPGVTIGRNSVIGAGSVVTGDIPLLCATFVCQMRCSSQFCPLPVDVLLFLKSYPTGTQELTEENLYVFPLD